MSNKVDAVYQQLRANAEAKIKQIGTTTEQVITSIELLHELQIHQIELEMQNEELQRIQMELEKSRDRYSDLYEFSPVGYLTLAEDGTITEINFTGENLLGTVRKKLLNRRFARFISSEYSGKWYLHLLNLKRNEGCNNKHCELDIIRGDGTTFYASLECLAINADDEKSVLRIALSDITELKNTKEALVEARNQADVANAFKSEFLMNMSHEMRTPLNSIIGTSYLFHRTELTQEQQAFLNNIDYAAHFLLNAINPILDLAKVEAGQLSLNLEPFSLDRLLSNVTKLLKIKAAQKNNEITYSIASDLPKCLIGDAIFLSKILTYLIDNALKYTANGQIVITVMSENSTAHNVSLRFLIQDDGVGISENLFNFSKTQNDLSLGLKMSKQLIELMGGHISVESVLEQGSLFSFILDFDVCVESSIVDTFNVNNGSQSISEHFLDSPSKCADLIGWRVLLVEDNEINREITAAFLTKLGVVVETAENGLDGLERVKSEPFDLVLMDIQMPIMDGLTATQEIRSDSRFVHLPIIAMSANGTKEDIEKGLAAGLNDYLIKPIYPQKLAEKLVLWLCPDKSLPESNV
jgi:PAS domain S-box-containing protein